VGSFMWSLGLAVFAVGVAVGVLGEDAPPLTFDPPASCNSHNFTWSSASLSCVKCSVPSELKTFFKKLVV